MEEAALRARMMELAAETGRPAPVAIDGRDLMIQIQGSGPVVLLCAPLGADLDYWDALAEQLTPHTTVIRYGRQANTGQYPGTRDVDDLAALIEYLDRPEPVVLVGASIGGLIARVAAGRALDKLAALVLVDGSCEDFEADPAVPEVFRERVRAEQDNDGIDRGPLDEAARAAGYLAPLEDLPIWVLCAGTKTWGTLASEDPAVGKVMDRRWLIHQRRQLGLSTDVRMSVVVDGDHHLALDAPDFVAEVIRNMLPWRQVRPGRPDKWLDPRAVDAVADWFAAEIAKPVPASLDAPPVTLKELQGGFGAAVSQVEKLRDERLPGPEKVQAFAAALRTEIVRLFIAGLQRGEGGLAPNLVLTDEGFSINIDNFRPDPVLYSALKAAELPDFVLPMSLRMVVMPQFVAVDRAGQWTIVWEHPTLPRPLCDRVEDGDDGHGWRRCGLGLLHNGDHGQWQLQQQDQLATA